nr:hypothetical protein [Pseudomonas sp.]
MTGLYEWNPMPYQLAIRCPRCSREASFEFAEARLIRRKLEVPLFQAHSAFEYQLRPSRDGHFQHMAVYFQGLHGDPRQALHDLPEGYQAADWSHSRYLRQQYGHTLGALVCDPCGLRSRHQLDWPGEAYYAVDYKNHLLWAYHRESALELRDYLLSIDRKLRDYRWAAMLLHVPGVFKTRKARAPLTQRLSRLLAGQSRTVHLR